MQEVASAIGKDRRIGDKFLHPGPGYGGSCFPKDVSALIRTARENKSPVSIIEQVQRVNDERKIAMAHRIEEAAGGSVRGKTIAILGVTFKPNTDDMRDAPSLVIVPMLQERGATVRVCDPQGRRQAEPLLPDVVWCESALEAATGADVLVTVTEWNEFRALDLKAAKAQDARRRARRSAQRVLRRAGARGWLPLLGGRPQARGRRSRAGAHGATGVVASRAQDNPQLRLRGRRAQRIDRRWSVRTRVPAAGQRSDARPPSSASGRFPSPTDPRRACSMIEAASMPAGWQAPIMTR